MRGSDAGKTSRRRRAARFAARAVGSSMPCACSFASRRLRSACAGSAGHQPPIRTTIRGSEPQDLLVQRPGRQLRRSSRSPRAGTHRARLACSKSLSNFFHNLRFPIVSVNNLLQGKPRDRLRRAGASQVNTVLRRRSVSSIRRPRCGAGAAERGLRPDVRLLGHRRRAVLVLPFFGPSNPRDAVGLAGDPRSASTRTSSHSGATVGATHRGRRQSARWCSRRGQRVKEASFDYYVVRAQCVRSSGAGG